MLSYYVIYYETFRKVMKQTEKVALMDISLHTTATFAGIDYIYALLVSLFFCDSVILFSIHRYICMKRKYV